MHDKCWVHARWLFKKLVGYTVKKATVPQEKITGAWDLDFVPAGGLRLGEINGQRLGTVKRKENQGPERKVGRGVVRCSADMACLLFLFFPLFLSFF